MVNPGRVGLAPQRRTGIEQGQASFTPSSPSATSSGGRALHYNMEGAGERSGPKNIKSQVVSNARILFDVLHDDKISADDKLSQITEVLRSDGVDVNFYYQHNEGNTWLHGAVTCCFVDIVKLLLEYKADVDSKNAEKETPLHIAASYGFVEIVKLLLEYKADVDSKNAEKETPLHIAASHGFVEIVKLLLEYKADVDSKNAEKKTPLYIAASHGFVEIVQLLLEYKADVDSKNAEKETPLHIAASHGFADIVKLLLEYKADVDSKNEEKETPLHTAASHGFVEIVQLLLEYKADVDLKNAKKETPFHIAVSHGFVDILEMFKGTVANIKKTNGDVGEADNENQNITRVTPLVSPKEIRNQEINCSFDLNDLFCTAPQDGQDNIASVATNENHFAPAASAVEDLADTYKVRGAKHSMHGTVYQLCLLNVFALRALSLGCTFQLGTEVKEAEQFDDIVLHHYTESGVRKTLFVQVKHKTKKDQGLHLNDLLAKGNNAEFSLLKYFKSFVKIKIAKEQEASKIVFAICTNAPINFRYKEAGKLKWFNVSNITFLETLKKLGITVTLLEMDKEPDTYKEFFTEGTRYKLHITETTVKLLKDYFDTEYTAELSSLKDCKSKLEVETKIDDRMNKHEGLKTEGKELTNKNTEEQSSLNDGISKPKVETEIDHVENKPEGLKSEKKELTNKNMEEQSSLNDVISKPKVETEIDQVENKPEGLKTEGKELTNKNTEEQSSLNDDISKPNVETEIDHVKVKSEGMNGERKEVSNKHIKELEDVLKCLNEGKSLETFLTNLIFVVKQEADNKLITHEIKRHIETTTLDTDLFTDAFYKQIFGWFSKKEGDWLKQKTVKEMIESIKETFYTFASSWITRVHAENLLTSPLKFNKDKLYELNKLMSENTIVHLETSMGSKLTLIQVAQALGHSGSYVALDSYMFMRVSSLLPCGNEELTVDAFKTPGKHDLLVIDCLSKTDKVTDEQLTLLGDKLLKITTNNPLKKLVIIAPEKHALAEMISSCSGYYKHPATHTWKDLTNETQDILLATEVYFQGQLVKLNQFIDKTETELLEIVPLETLIGDEGLVIGTKLPTHICYNESVYIDRSVNCFKQIVLKANIFENKSKMQLREGFTLTESDFQSQCMKQPGENIHLIEKQGEKYAWVKTQGELKALRPYIDYTNCQSFSEEDFLNSVEPQRVVIISDLAGMGKSTVLTHFSNTIKANYGGTFLFRINLNDYTELFTKEKTNSTIIDYSSAFEFLCEEIIQINTPLERALLKRKGKVVLLFDGFDEVSPNYEETVLGLIQNLIGATKAQIWITTRPFMKEKLEDKLGQWSSSLEPFSKQTQEDFLIKYWKHMENIKDSDEDVIKDFASSLVLQLSESISDKEREFTGIPLQMKMLAECFFDDKAKSVDLNKCFNLVDLYTKFIDKKFEILDTQKNKSVPSIVGVEENLKFISKFYIRQHQWLALSVILLENKSDLFLPDFKEVINSFKDLTNINKIGIVNVTNGKPHFIHRTFAEYCVGLYFMELLKSPECINSDVKSFLLSELLKSNHYWVVRSFLNGLLTKCQPATYTLGHLKNPLLSKDDINNKYKEIKKIFVQTAIEGNNNICIFLLNGVEKKDEEVLKLLQGADRRSDNTMLHSAATHNNAKFIGSFLKWALDNTGQGQDIVRRMLEARDKGGMISLHMASSAGHNDVVKTLLQWTRDNLFEGPEVVKQMLEACNMRGWTSLHMASWEGHNGVVQTLLQWTHDNLELDEELVQRMLEACNEQGETSLHRAAEAGHLNVVHTLLQWTRDNLEIGQDIVKRMLEARDGDGDTPLLWASGQGRNDVVQTLLQWARDNLEQGEEIVKEMLEARDRRGKTPLEIASAQQGHNDVLQTLRQWTHGH